jgi:hypothetical protein
MAFSLGTVSTGFRHLGRKRVILAFHVVSISGLGSEHLELICKLSFSFFPFFFFFFKSLWFWFFPPFQQRCSRCSRGG